MDWDIQKEIIRRSWKILLEIYFYITVPLLALIILRIIFSSIGVLFEFMSWILAGPLLFSLFHVTDRFVKGRDFEVKDYFYFLKKEELKKHWPILILPQVLMFIIFQVTAVLHGSVFLSIGVVLFEAFLSILLTVLQLKALEANERGLRLSVQTPNQSPVQATNHVPNRIFGQMSELAMPIMDQLESSRSAFDYLKFEMPQNKMVWKLWCGYTLTTLFICSLCLLLFVLPFFFVALPMWIVSNFVFVYYLKNGSLPDIKESSAK